MAFLSFLLSLAAVSDAAGRFTIQCKQMMRSFLAYFFSFFSSIPTYRLPGDVEEYPSFALGYADRIHIQRQV